MQNVRSSTAWFTLIIFINLALFQSKNAFSQEFEDPIAGHVFLGEMNMENNSPDVDGGDYKITIFGVDAQRPLNTDRVRYGLEVGGLFSLDSEARQFRASSGSAGGSVSVSVDINSLMIDFFYGAYMALHLTDWLRFYAGGGPLLIYGRRETEPEESATEEDSTETESGLGAGVYVRAGIDVYFTHNVGLNAGVRITQTTLSFEDTPGKVDIEGWQYYAGLAFHF